MKKRLSLLSIVCICGMVNLHATVHYVTPDGTGDGTSWAQASGDLQAIIDISEEGDEVWIAGGVYKPQQKIAESVSNSQSFILKNGVSLYGSFAGIESTLEARDIMEDGGAWDFAHPTYFDGDDEVEDNWQREIAPGTTYRYTWHLENNQIPGTAGNSCHLLYSPDVITSHTIIDGITFKGGAANQHKAKTYGGAVYAQGNVSISRCVFMNNLAYFRNEPISNDINAFGGALFLNGAGDASVSDCFFYRNYANSSYTLGRGGGLFTQNAKVERCVFDQCVAEDGGGGAYIIGGSITDCEFIDCYGSAGGGLLTKGTAEKITAQLCRGLNGGGIYVDENGTLSRGMIYDCYADAEEFGEQLGGSGGGLFVMNATAVGCVVYNNYAFNGGGVCVRGDSKVVNSTIQNNDSRRSSLDAINAATWGGEEDPADFYFNCITDPNLSDANFVKPSSFIGLAEDSGQLLELAQTDWRLAEDSPLIDTGTLTSGFDEPTDFAGNDRIQGEGIDPGAYETDSTISAPMIISDKKSEEQWFTIQGQMLKSKPTDRGIYIHRSSKQETTVTLK